MNLSKLKKLHVIIIGSVLCVGAVAAVFFLMIKPQQEAYNAAEAEYERASQLGNEQALQRAEMALAQATLEAARVQQALDVQMEKRMPRLNFANRETGMLALWREQLLNLGPLLEKFAQDTNPDVHVLSGSFQLPAPPVNPNDPVFSQDVLVFPLGQVQAQGDFRSLMNNIRRWNNCNRLVMVGPPVLAGTSPRLTVAYNVTCYVYPAAKAPAGSLVQMAGGGTTQQGMR